MSAHVTGGQRILREAAVVDSMFPLGAVQPVSASVYTTRETLRLEGT